MRQSLYKFWKRHKLKKDLKITREDWNSEYYIIPYSYDETHVYCKDVFNKEYTSYTRPFLYLWKIWKPTKKVLKPKLITWYRPKIVWYKGKAGPIILSYDTVSFRQDKSCWYREGDVKVLEWEIIEAPETWEECP